jgi:predicted permease
VIFRRQTIDEELQFHFDRLVEDLIAGGLDPAQAREQARRRMGNLDDVRAECAAIETRRARAESLRRWLADLRQDLWLALRQISHRRAFSLGVVITLALGLGANYAIFAALDALVLHPLRGVSAPHELVIDSGTISTEVSGGAFPIETGNLFSLPALRDFRDQSRAVQVAGYANRTVAVDDSEIAAAMLVSGNYFDTVRPRMESGRPLGEADDLPGAPLVAVVSHRFAQRRSLRINGQPVEIVGVAGRDFRGTKPGASPEVWLPISSLRRLAQDSSALEARNWGWVAMIGRLRPGVSLAAAQSELSGIAARINAAWPDQLHYSIRLTPIEARSPVVKIFAAALAGVALLVLLLACANVANLLLARAAARRREIAVRSALGATRSRVVRQLLAEALLLSLLGGTLGFWLAHFATRAMPLLPLPDGLSLPEIGLAGNGRVVAFAALLSLCTALLFGLPPALQATRVNLTDSLKNADGRQRSRLRDLLLIVQVSLSVVLLIGTGLFLRALERGLRVDTGFHPERLSYASVNVGLAHHDAARAAAEYRQILEAVSKLPGVTSAAWTTTLPLSDSEDIAMARPEGHVPQPGEDLWVEVAGVSDSYFATMGLQLLSGRGLQPHESQPVMLLSRSAERRFFPGASALGKHIVLTHDGPSIEVVGVVADARYHALEGEPRALAYLPFERETSVDTVSLIVNGAPRDLSQTIREVSPGIPVLASGRLREKLVDLLAPQRLGMIFLGAFAALGLLLAFVGTASVTAFVLAQRTRELGIRLALGANGPMLLAMVLAQTLQRVGIGLGVGAGVAIVSMRGVAAFLYGVPPADPLTFAAAGILMLGSGLAAAMIPAVRILRIDPAISLRSE